MPGKWEGKTILVVEDNELNMKLFNDLLEAHGYRVVQTRDGLSALDMARKHMPDLILMDIQLPEVSGLEVTKWLKEDDDLQSIPVIAVSAQLAAVPKLRLALEQLARRGVEAVGPQVAEGGGVVVVMDSPFPVQRGREARRRHRLSRDGGGRLLAHKRPQRRDGGF